MTYSHIKATPGDAAVLAPLNKRLIEDEGHRNQMGVEALCDRMRGWLEGEYEAYYVTGDGRILAYALYRNAADHVYLRQLFVERDHRRQGIGKNLFEWLMANVWKDRAVRLDVLSGNETGLSFWRALGFRDYCVTMERPRGNHDQR